MVGGPSAVASFVEVDVLGGSLRFARAIIECSGLMRLTAMRIHSKGSVIFNEVSGCSAVLDLRGLRLEHEGQFVIHGSAFDGEALIDMSGARNLSGSNYLADMSLEGNAEVRLHGVENEDEESVMMFLLRLMSKDSSVSVAGGGNYGGHLHFELWNTHRKAHGRLDLAGAALMNGYAEIRIDDGIRISFRERTLHPHSHGKIHLIASTAIRRLLSRASEGSADFVEPGNCHSIRHFDQVGHRHGSRWEFSFDELHVLKTTMCRRDARPVD